MKRSRKGIILPVLGAVFFLFSCLGSPNYYDNEEYESIVASNFPVDSIDEEHDWQTLRTAVVTVSVSTTVDTTFVVSVYDSSPVSNDSVTLYGEKEVDNGDIVTFNISYPSVKSAFWVTLRRGSRFITKKVSLVSSSITAYFTIADTVWRSHEYTVTDFYWRYCFEDDFPSLGDFDFNDIVLTTSLSHPLESPKKVVLSVSLDAVGTLLTLGAAIRLAGMGQNDIDSVTRDGDFDQYEFYFGEIGNNMTSYGYQLGLNNVVIIPLFTNAHYAMSRGELSSDGSVKALFYNTVGKASGSDYDDYTGTADPDTVTYTIHCRSASVAQSITQSTIDAFIETDYNGGYFEIHAFPYKREESLYEWMGSSSDDVYTDNYPWALKLPGTFRYPQEGVTISHLSGNMIWGAYCTPFHSFSEWALDEDEAEDWYTYPSTSMVY